MSQQLHIEAILEPDGKWLRMKAVWQACQAAGVEVPEEVKAYFDFETPDEAGPVFNLKESRHYRTSDPVVYGLEFDVKDLPVGTKTVRFVIS